MTVYTVHEPMNAPADPFARAERVEFVKEGIAWWALLAPVLWLIYQRMWLALIGYLAVLVLLQLALSSAGLGEAAAGWATLALSLLFAVEANDLRRWTLKRRGYRMIGAVSGQGRDAAELKFFEEWPQAAAPAPKPAAAVPDHARPGSAEGDDVIGLFPEPER